MKIAAFTVGNIDTASSRLRSFYPFSTATASQAEIFRYASMGEARDCDVIHIQKVWSYHAVKWAFRYRMAGKLVVFDIDDMPDSLRAYLKCIVLILISTFITVDSTRRKHFLKAIFLFKRIYVLNDAIDFDGPLRESASKIDFQNIFWIGYSPNFYSLKPFTKFLKYQERYRLIACVEASAIQRLSLEFPDIQFIPWKKNISFSTEVNSKFAILSHRHNFASSFKSDNKMVMSLFAGMIPIVSRTPSYARLAKKLRIENVIFDNESEILGKCDRLQEVGFKVNSEHIQYLIKHYSSESVFDRFLKLVHFHR